MIRRDKNMKNIDKIQNNITGALKRKLTIKNKEIYILYIPQLTNKDSLSENIIKPLLQYNGEKEISADLILESIIYIDEANCENDENKITDYIIEGKSVIIIHNDNKYIVANTLKVEKRSIESPEIESSIRSPRDAFTENLDTNLSLIRHRIKDSSLKIDNCIVGRRTKTSVAVIYIEDIANSKYVVEIKNKLLEIDVDGVLESGDIQKFISNKNTTLFSQIGISERSDSTCAHVLDGKVAVLVDGSNIALITPKNFVEFFDAGDDHYDNTFTGRFSKALRLMALIIALTLSSLYVALVAFHPDILPSQYILALAGSRIGVPVNASMEAMAMEAILEMLIEANIRLPKQVGPSISIVGTIVIGQALVSAGLVSPLMVIIVSLSSMASFAVGDYTIMNPIRLLKFFMILITGVFGLFGFIMGLTIILIKLTSITSLGIPYTSPIAPFNFQDVKSFILSNKVLDRERPNFLKVNNKKKQNK